MLLSEYKMLPREERTAHIDLSTPCFRTEVTTKISKQDICDFLGVEDDVPNWKVGGVERCHLCDCDSLNGNCENPLHIYLGPPVDNAGDIDFEVRSRNSKAIAERQKAEGINIYDPEVRRKGSIASGKLAREKKFGAFFDPSCLPFWISTVTGHISQHAGTIAVHNKARGGTSQDRVRLSDADAQMLLKLGASRFARSKHGSVRPPFNTGEVK